MARSLLPFPRHGESPLCMNWFAHFCEAYPPHERRFDPLEWYVGDEVPNSIFDYEGLHQIPDGWTHLTCPGRCRCNCCGRRGFSELDPLIIAVDGACPGNGTTSCRGSIGVWFGYIEGLQVGNPWNISTQTDDYTNQQAELTVAAVALERFNKLVQDGMHRCVCSLIIKSDSAYVVNGITKDIFTWKSNGWYTSAGKPVANKAWWKRLENVVQAMEETGTRVLFWHVRREWNTLADALAKAALLEDESDRKYVGVNAARKVYMDGRHEWMGRYKDLCQALEHLEASRAYR